MKENKISFDKITDAVKEKYSFAPEQEKFTWYDETGEQIYRLLAEINDEIISLHDVVRNKVFNDIDYYGVVDLAKLWFRDAGHSQESALSRGMFEKLVAANDNYITHKFLYYHDCEALVNALQNRFTVVDDLLNKIFQYISPKQKYLIGEYDDVIYSANPDTTVVYSYINSIIINLASSCDLMTKIAFELGEMDGLDFAGYPKMVSSSVLYGQAKKLPDALKEEGTYFAPTRPVAVKKVESFRDEIIHNGSTDFYYNVYYGMKDGELESWILWPEFTKEGTFATYNARKKFYGDAQRTLNEQLPKLVKEFLEIALKTLQVVRSQYECSYYENAGDVKKYAKEIMRWTTATVNVLKEEGDEGHSE